MRTFWNAFWLIVNGTLALGALFFGFGIPLLWMIPGVTLRHRTGRTLGNALGWLAWLGPFGLIPLIWGTRREVATA